MLVEKHSLRPTENGAQLITVMLDEKIAQEYERKMKKQSATTRQGMKQRRDMLQKHPRKNQFELRTIEENGSMKNKDLRIVLRILNHGKEELPKITVDELWNVLSEKKIGKAPGTSDTVENINNLV